MTDPTTVEKAAETKTAGKTKERSPNYPALALTDSIEHAQKLYDKEKRTTVSLVDAAKALGYGGLSGPARTAVASLRQYGLVENSKDGIRVSDLAMEILHHPVGSMERDAAVRTSAKKPPLIAELIPTHRDASDESLKSHLILKKKFSSDGAGRFVAAFRDALKLSGLIDAGYEDEQTGEETGDQRKTPAPGKTPNPPPPKPGASMQFTWPLSGDVVATLTVSREIETDDVEILADYFATAKKALLKAARVRSAEPVKTEASNGSAQT